MEGLIEQENPNLAANMSPEQVKQFKDGYRIARTLIYQKDVFENLTQDVQSQGPVNVLANAVVQVLHRAQESVGKLELRIAAALGIALLDDIASALEEAGAAEYSREDQIKAFEQATYIWLQSNEYPDEEIMSVFQESGGDPATLQQAQQASQGPAAAPETPQQNVEASPLYG